MSLSESTRTELRNCLSILKVIAGVVLLAAISWEIIAGDHMHFSRNYLIIQLVVCIPVSYTHLLAARHNWGLRKDKGAAYIYNGAFWALIDDAELEWFLGKAAEQMGVYVFNSRHYLFREKLRKQFCASAYLTPSVRKTDEVLINLRNGTFEISPAHRRCRPFNRQDFLTYQLPFNYDPAAEAPMFRKYLERVLPDESCQKVLAEYIGLSLIHI